MLRAFPMVALAVSASTASSGLQTAAPPAVVRVGVLMPMFRPSRLNYRRAGHWADSSRSAIFLAFREINNKTDGIADHLLPETHLAVAYADSRCDGGYGVAAALEVARDAFNGHGVSGIVGTGCSSSATTAAYIGGAAHIPMISPGSTSPAMSDGLTFPFFLRTVPVNTFRAEGIVDLLRNLFNYTEVAVVWTTSNSGGHGVDGMRTASVRRGLQLNEFVIVDPESSRETSTVCSSLHEIGARVIVLMLSASASKLFIRRAYDEFGIGGDGYLWFGLQTLTDLGDGTASIGLLKGYFAIALSAGQGALYERFEENMMAEPSTTGDAGVCSAEMDDQGKFLWAADHDEDGATPMECAGDDHSRVSFWAAYAYDAVYAMAHALHEVINVRNRTEVVGSELLAALIERVRFDGVTGLVEFHDASAEPSREGHGDRQVGVSYTLFNHIGDSRGLVALGLWSPCAVPSCDWLERWRPTHGTVLTYSTSDNRRLSQTAP